MYCFNLYKDSYSRDRISLLLFNINYVLIIKIYTIKICYFAFPYLAVRRGFGLIFAIRIQNLRMTIKLLSITACFFSMVSYAQIENPKKTVLFEKIEKLDTSTSGLEFNAKKNVGLTTPKEPNYKGNYENLGKKEEESFSISTDEGFVDTKTDIQPRGFKKDKEIKEEYKNNQYLGDFKTSSKFATIQYRDHEYVDGDRVRIFINEDVVKSNEYLQGGFSGFTFPLQDGFNKIDFQALNQGDSGPNTAELLVSDENGKVLFHSQWNLATGYTATVIIVKE